MSSQRGSSRRDGSDAADTGVADDDDAVGRTSSDGGEPPGRVATSAPEGPGRGPRRMLHAFTFPSYRRLWAATVLLSFSNWMVRFSVGWLVLESTDSVFLAALSFAVNMAPNMLLGPIAGTVVDRVERRRLMVITAATKCAIVATIGIVMASGVTAVWPVLVLVAMNGSMRTFEFPATQALIVDIVGVRNATNAIGLYSVGARTVGVIGAFSGGVVIAVFGGAPVFFAAATLLGLGAIVIRTLRTDQRPRRPTGVSLWSDALEGLRLIAGIPVVLTLLVLTVAVEIFAFSYQSMLPAVAGEVLDIGSVGLGTLTLGAGVGSVAGSLALSLLGDFQRRGLLMLGVILAFGGFLVAFGLSQHFLMALVLVVGVGAMAAMFDALQWILLQANVPDEMRGRVLGAWMTAIGLGWLGPLTLGAIGQLISVPVALTGAGMLVLVLGVATALFVPQLKRA